MGAGERFLALLEMTREGSLIRATGVGCHFDRREKSSCIGGGGERFLVSLEMTRVGVVRFLAFSNNATGTGRHFDRREKS
jgi:hypothetical protein